MNELIVVTFKMPAEAWAKKFWGDDLEYTYDCEAYNSDEIAEHQINKLRHKYEDVDSFVCSKDAYYAWIDDGAAYKEFVRTGVCPLKSMNEDVDVGTNSKTVTIICEVRLERETSKASFDYKVDIDDVGQIVFTPYDVETRFCHEGEDVTPGENVKFETVNLTAQMISESGNYEYFVGTDDVGQFVITPDVEDTSFLTVSVGDSLNLVTESAEGINMPDEEYPSTEWPGPDYNEYVGKRCQFLSKFTGSLESGTVKSYEGCSGDPMDDFVGCDSSYEYFVIEQDDGTIQSINVENVFCEGYGGKNMKVLKEANKYRDFDWTDDELYAVIKNDGTYAGVPCRSYSEAKQLAYHPGSKIFKLVLDDDATEEPLEESLSEVDRMSVVDRVLRGELSVFSDNGEPDPSYILIPELTNEQGKVVFEYYYDQDSEEVVSYSRPRTEA